MSETPTYSELTRDEQVVGRDEAAAAIERLAAREVPGEATYDVGQTATSGYASLTYHEEFIDRLSGGVGHMGG